jgi:hypothetical protein
VLNALRDRDERDAIPVEHLDQLGKVGQRAAEAVDLVDHDHVDQPVLDVLQQAFQAGAVQRAARDTAVIILLPDEHPSLRPLAGDVRLAGLALSVEAVELLLQPFFGGFAGVDGAAAFQLHLAHHRLPRRFKPKKISPFQRVPVIARAIADNDL